MTYHNYKLHMSAIVGNDVLQLIAICVFPVKIIVMTSPPSPYNVLFRQHCWISMATADML